MALRGWMMGGVDGFNVFIAGVGKNWVGHFQLHCIALET
jgi:hypothetical protein